ncbi:pyroglutamyl-peptidase I [Microbacterium sp. gxy059]|uniref:pyroglutamyl-peptidase I n=1 Tax=Microbacterium sp. gxy059 TaxID=2957199 RepID=UPI003D95964A
MTTTVLLTGFEPFGGDDRNPSAEAVDAVAARWAGPETLVAATLPVAFDEAARELRALIDETDPDVVIATGLAGGRTAVTPERVAINLVDARIPDNAGRQPADEPSVAGAPNALFATLPTKAIAAAIREAGIPSAVSYSAGTFVCNHVAFAASHATEGRDARAGFVHLPWSDETAPDGAPSLPAADLARALEIAIRTALDTPQDLAEPGGAIH